MKAQIDTGLGRSASLADVDNFRLLAQNLSESGAYEIYLSDDTRSVEELDTLRVMLTGEAGAYKWLVNDDQERQANKVFFWDSNGTSVGVQLDSPLEEVQQLRQELQQSLLNPYLAYGTGRGVNSVGEYIGKYIIILLVHENEELARENATLLQRRIEEAVSLTNSQPWREIVDLEGLEIETDGRFLRAKLPLSDQEFTGGIPIYQSSFTLDGLLLHGE